MQFVSRISPGINCTEKSQLVSIDLCSALETAGSLALRDAAGADQLCEGLVMGQVEVTQHSVAMFAFADSPTGL